MTIIPVHDFVILLNFLLYVCKFALQIFTSLPLLLVCWVLQPETGKVIFGVQRALTHRQEVCKHVNRSIYAPLTFPVSTVCGTQTQTDTIVHVIILQLLKNVERQ